MVLLLELGLILLLLLELVRVLWIELSRTFGIVELCPVQEQLRRLVELRLAVVKISSSKRWLPLLLFLGCRVIWYLEMDLWNLGLFHVAQSHFRTTRWCSICWVRKLRCWKTTWKARWAFLCLSNVRAHSYTNRERCHLLELWCTTLIREWVQFDGVHIFKAAKLFKVGPGPTEACFLQWKMQSLLPLLLVRTSCWYDYFGILVQVLVLRFATILWYEETSFVDQVQRLLQGRNRPGATSK